MVELGSHLNTSDFPLEDFGMKNLSVAELERVANINNSHLIMQSLVNLPKGQLAERGVLLWASANCVAWDHHEQMEAEVKEFLKEDRQMFEEARVTIWRTQFNTKFEQIMKVFQFIKANRSLALTSSYLEDCKTLPEMKRKIAIYQKLTKGRLEELRDWRTVKVFEIDQDHSYLFQQGEWEEYGGISLALHKNDKEIMRVGGRLQKLTDVVSIHGGEGKEQEIKDFREKYGIHPANLTLLLYLRLGQALGHDKAIIPSQASRKYNNHEKNSSLYDIPRNYFRLKEDSNMHNYKLDKDTINRIFEKFGRNPSVAENFVRLENYLSNC